MTKQETKPWNATIILPVLCYDMAWFMEDYWEWVSQLLYLNY